MVVVKGGQSELSPSTQGKIVFAEVVAEVLQSRMLLVSSSFSPVNKSNLHGKRRSQFDDKVCTISFERHEASPRTFTVLVQLSAFHYLTAF